MDTNSAIYRELVNAAHRKKSVTYGTLAAMAGLDTTQQQDRTKLGEILGTISTYEHQNGRPLLSVVAWFSGKAEPSEGFYKLADSLGVYSTGQDKDVFFYQRTQQNL